MSPLNHHVASQLRQLIYYHLDCNLPRNALFFAGRLHAFEPRATTEAAFLLALCYLRLGQYRAAYDYSKVHGSRGTHLGCSYTYAQACLWLGFYNEGITALDRSKTLWAGKSNWNKHTETRRQHLPDAAAVYCLQGKLLHAYEDTERAIDCYAEALKLNPFMWDAFLALCDLGVHIRMPNIFKMTQEMETGVSPLPGEEGQGGIFDEPSAGGNTQTNTVPSGVNDPFAVSTSRANAEIRPLPAKGALFEKLNGSTALVTPMGGAEGFEEMETPSGPSAALAATRARDTGTALDNVAEPPHAPMRKVRAVNGLGVDMGTEAPRMKTGALKSRLKPTAEGDEGEAMAPTLSTFLNDRKRTASGKTAMESSIPNSVSTNPGAPQRRSVRLFNSMTTRSQGAKASSNASSLSSKEGREIKKIRAPGTRTKTGQLGTGRAVSGNRKPGEGDADQRSSSLATSASIQSRGNHDRAKEQEALQLLLDLLLKLGRGYHHLTNFHCQEAFLDFNSIPVSQKETPWVLAQMGRALFEQAQYTEAEKYFARMRTIAPAALEDMDIYSTTLWHCKNEIDLAYLAHELQDINRLAPESWVAIGNSFSLRRDHDQALKCFKRATQLNPSYAYAFALQGHEHVSNEEYDKALASYRNGVAADHRHYNSWYGLGKVYEKQGKYEMAEQHYRTAAAINPTNPVLLLCIGGVLEKMKRPQQALELYTRSIELSPRSSLARYRRARILAALGRTQHALSELLMLKDLSPDEANVHFLLGQVYKKMRMKGDAIKHFTTALNLDPKVRVKVTLRATGRLIHPRHLTTSKKPWSKWKSTRGRMGRCNEGTRLILVGPLYQYHIAEDHVATLVHEYERERRVLQADPGDLE
jgi:anaphase-promoting complex subunit 3